MHPRNQRLGKGLPMTVLGRRRAGRAIPAGEDALRKYLTAETALTAVSEDGLALRDVPEEMKTAEVCLAAVRQNRGAGSNPVVAWRPCAWTAWLPRF